MSRILLLRIDPTATQASWQLVENGQLVGPQGSGSPADAQRAARGVPVVVLVPAEEIYLDYVALPGKNRQKLRRAIPYAVEDRLIDDVENLHFALSNQPLNGRYLVAAVENRMIDFWDKAMIKAGIRVETILPDVTALGQSAGTWTVLLESERALVRTPNELFATDIASLPIMLENLCAGLGDNEPPVVKLYDCSNTDKAVLLAAENPELKFDVTEVAQGAFAVFAGTYDPQSAVNLLQGEYNRQEGWRKQLKPWYSAAALLLVWLSWQVILNIGNYFELSRTSKQLTVEMDQVHKRAFAGAKTPLPGYERSDMEAKLKEMRKRQGRSSGSLQEMLVATAPILKDISGIVIDGIHYQNGVLNIDLTMQDTSKLESLKQRLQTQTGWDVKSQASTQKGITQVRLKITSNV